MDYKGFQSNQFTQEVKQVADKFHLIKILNMFLEQHKYLAPQKSIQV